MVSLEASGKNQLSMGSMKREVLIAEKVEVDIVKITIPQSITGSQSMACGFGEPSAVTAKSFAIKK
jgi:hypothetical protein